MPSSVLLQGSYPVTSLYTVNLRRRAFPLNGSFYSRNLKFFSISHHTLLHQCQVYSIVVRHLHNLQSVPCNQSSPHPTPHSYRDIADYIPRAAVTPPWPVCNCQFVSLNSFPSSRAPDPPPIWHHLRYLWVCFCLVCLFGLVFRFRTWVRSRGLRLSLSDYFT